MFKTHVRTSVWDRVVHSSMLSDHGDADARPDVRRVRQAARRVRRQRLLQQGHRHQVPAVVRTHTTHRPHIYTTDHIFHRKPATMTYADSYKETGQLEKRQ